ncbi:MAG: leucine-rich repeat domain-containing protein [Bacilli bacterium]|nr:leucine-rich repeat domain-containing protein [Bacilli bacterium]
MKKGLILKMVLSAIMITSIMSIMIIGEYSNVFAADASSSNTGSFDGEHVFIDGTCTDCGAAGGDCGENLTWLLSEDKTILTISGTGEMTTYTLQTRPWVGTKTTVTTLIIEEGVTSVSAYAFEGFDAITSISLPNSLITIANRAFFDCDGYKTLVIPDNVETIGANAFQYSAGLKSVTFGSNLKSIGEKAFYQCSYITSIVLPEGLNEVGASAFGNIASLRTVTLPSTLIKIPGNCFRDCSNLTTINFHDKLEYIGTNAFLNCKKLNNVVLPDSLRTINDSAFSSCSGLSTIDLGNGVESIGNSAFNATKLTSLHIPASVTTLGSGTTADIFGSTETITEITVDENNQYFSSDNGVLYNKQKTILIKYPTAKTDTSYVLEEGVSEIAYRAFYYSTNITLITIPSSLTKIGNQAFYNNTSLTNVHYHGTADNFKELKNNIGTSNTKFTGATISVSVFKEGVAATCTSDGIEEGVYCELCAKYIYGGEVSPAGHSIKSYEAKKATCSEVGWEAYEACENCDLSTYKETPKLDHTFGEWEEVQESTYDTPGKKIRTCECGSVETQRLPVKNIAGILGGFLNDLFDFISSFFEQLTNIIDSLSANPDDEETKEQATEDLYDLYFE